MDSSVYITFEFTDQSKWLLLNLITPSEFSVAGEFVME